MTRLTGGGTGGGRPASLRDLRFPAIRRGKRSETLAEGEGVEPSIPYGIPALQAGAIGH